MALRYGFPKSDNLLCAHVVCNEKATQILHLKDGKEFFYCDAHFPMEVVGQPNVARVEKLRQAGERNTDTMPSAK